MFKEYFRAKLQAPAPCALTFIANNNMCQIKKKVSFKLCKYSKTGGLTAGNKLEGEVGDKVSLEAQTSPYFQ